MPIGTSPNSTFPYILESDRDRDNPPTFICKYFSVKESKQFYKLHKKQEAAGDDVDKLFDIFIEIIVLGLVGWENMDPIGKVETIFPADKEELSDLLMELLTVDEVTDLMGVIIDHGVNQEDKKKLDLPLVSDTAVSAKTAKALINAPISPPSIPPSLCDVPIAAEKAVTTVKTEA